MMRALSERERRLVALLLLIALLAGAYYALVAPILDGFASRAEKRAHLSLRAQHNQRTIAALPHLGRQAAQQRAAAADYEIEASSPEAGREWLQERLRHAVVTAGGEYQDGADGEGRTGWVHARARARLTLPQLVAVLTSLQAEPPWLIVESLAVTANDALAGGPSLTMDVDIEAAIPVRIAAAR